MPSDTKTILLVNRLRATVLVLTAALFTTGAFAHQQIRQAHHAQRIARELRASPPPQKTGEIYSRQEVMELEWELYKQRITAEE